MIAIAAAHQRCWCGQHDVGHACPVWVHEAYKRDRARLVLECTCIGVEEESGEWWNCHCGGTLLVVTSEGGDA